MAVATLMTNASCLGISVLKSGKMKTDGKIDKMFVV